MVLYRYKKKDEIKTKRYRFKVEKKNELLNGRYQSDIAKEMGVTKDYLSLVLLGKCMTTFPFAYTISSFVGHKKVKYYFDIVEIEKGE